MTADYTYYLDDLVESVTCGNGTSVWYTYDDARRLTSMEHRSMTGDVMLRMAYGYDDRDLPVTVTESDQAAALAVVWYDYDDRGGLS